MKIAFVTFTNFPEGEASARRVHMMGKGLALIGHKVHVIVPQRFQPGPLFQEVDGLQVHWGNVVTPTTGSTLGARLAARRAAVRLVGQLAADGLDWLVLYNLGLEGIPLLLAARRYGAQVAAEYCDLRARPQLQTMEARPRYLWLRTADMIIPRLTQLNIVISTFLERLLRSLAARTPILVVPPLVDTGLFQNQPARAKTFRTSWQLGNVLVVSYLGGYWNVDGVGVLLKAASELATVGERFRLVISGAALEGRDCDDVPQLMAELGLRDRTVLTGWLPTDEVVAAMSAADVLVVPKLDHIANVAGVPTKLAEYLAVGKAVVTSRVGDIPLYLSDYEDALLCDPGDARSLAAVLQRVLRDSELRGHLARNARQTAIKHFDYRAAARQIEAAMRQASQ